MTTTLLLPVLIIAGAVALGLIQSTAVTALKGGL